MPTYDQNYVLGRGELHFKRFAPNTTTGIGEHYMGNTPGFEITFEEEVLEHFSSDAGLRVKDRSVALSNDASGTLTVDNISAETLSFFMAATPGDGSGSNPNFMGISSITQAAITAGGGAETLMDVNVDRWYQLGLVDADVPALARSLGIGVKDASIVSVVEGADTILSANGANWELDSENGRLWIPSGGTILAGEDVIVTFNAAAKVYNVVADGEQSVYGSLRFIAKNAVGAQRNFFLPYVKLTPAGAIALKGDDWQQAQMNIEVLKLNSSTPRVVTY
jgi:hypothetical protein